MSVNENEKVAIGTKKVAIDEQKVAIESIQSKCIEAGLSAIMTESILERYTHLEPNQIFGRNDVANYMNFSYANALKSKFIA